MIDISTLTLGEVAKIEDLSGLPIATLADEERPKGLALAAVAFVVKRRTGHPEFTWNEAQDLTFQEVSDLLGLDTDDDEDDDDPKDDSETSETSY